MSDDVETELQRGGTFIPFEHSVGDQKVSMTVGNERFLVPECIFNPRVMGIETWGIQDAIQTVIGRCDHAIQAELFGNVVLAGKGSLFRGFDKRLQAELEKKAPEGMAVCVTRTPNPSHASWLGGSMIAQGPDFEKMSVSLDEYNEYGPSLNSKFV